MDRDQKLAGEHTCLILKNHIGKPVIDISDALACFDGRLTTLSFESDAPKLKSARCVDVPSKLIVRAWNLVRL